MDSMTLITWSLQVDLQDFPSFAAGTYCLIFFRVQFTIISIAYGETILRSRG